MSNMAVKLKPEPLRFLSFTSVSTGYGSLGTPFKHPISLFHIINDLDVDIIVSFFNAEDHLFVKQGSFTLYDVAANKDEPAGYRAFPKETQIQIKSIGGASAGGVYLSTFYGSES